MRRRRISSRQASPARSPGTVCAGACKSLGLLASAWTTLSAFAWTLALAAQLAGPLCAQDPTQTKLPAILPRLAAERLAPDQLALPAQRLTMEQVVELATAGKIKEALEVLDKLFDEAEDRLVPVPRVQFASTLQTQRFIPLSVWVGATTAQLLNEHPEAAVDYRAGRHDQAQVALSIHQAQKDVDALLQDAQRYFATEAGQQFYLLLADLYLENGWGVAAAEAAQQVSALTRVRLPSQPISTTRPPRKDSSLSAALAWRQLTSEQRTQWLSECEAQLLSASESDPQFEQKLTEAVRRLLFASAVSPRHLDAAAIGDWARAMAGLVAPPLAETLNGLAAHIEDWSELPLPEGPEHAFAYTASHTSPAESDLQPAEFGKSPWPAWHQSLERFAAGNDRTSASRPRVGESERGTLCYFPAVYKGKVYVNELTQITAFDLQDGKSWPATRTVLPLFDSQLAPSSYMPLGYPLVGAPRGTVEIAEDCLYARMGSPVTGRISPRRPSEQQSSGYLIGLDLEKQGRLLPGFPLHLAAPEFPEAEFDGPPLVWGDRLLVPIAERDNVGLRRSVAAFDRLSGELIWKSNALAVGTVVGGESANLIAHQMLCMAGGRLFYNTNLGTIACLDPLTGRTQWLVLYASPGQETGAEQPARFRYRSLTPCLVSASLVFCAPQDTPEIFALDVTTGDLVWSTDDQQTADAVHVLGATTEHLLVSGDRLIWLDKYSGRTCGRFPASTTPGPRHALPNPRGLGRGTLAGDYVYWPTASEIFVFPAHLGQAASIDAPPIAARIGLDSRGSEGGNLLLHNRWMIVTSPSRLMAFHAKP